jgi:uncharacterized protein
MIKVPKEVLDLWNKYGLDEEARKHCIKVTEVALRIARSISFEVDENAVKLGALLHDIGRAVTHDRFHHFIASGEILRKEGFDEKIALIAERHFAAGLEKMEAKTFGLPEKDYLPITLEEKIVSLADNLVMGNRENTFEEFLRRLDEIAKEKEFKWIVDRTRKRAIKLKEEVESLIKAKKW